MNIFKAQYFARGRLQMHQTPVAIECDVNISVTPKIHTNYGTYKSNYLHRNTNRNKDVGNSI